MKRIIVLSTKTALSLVLLLPFAACGGATDDASVGKTKNALGADLKEGDICPDSKCDDQGFLCSTVGDGQPAMVATNLRCVAGPQVGSGVGVCQLTGECVPALKEGDPCPAERCGDGAFACAVVAGSPPLTAQNVRCVAGPQVGSGVGACQLVGDCVP
jgi:hypothetical protein